MGTRKVSVREAREGLRRLLDQVQAGDEVVVLRRGSRSEDSSGPSESPRPFLT